MTKRDALAKIAAAVAAVDAAWSAGYDQNAGLWESEEHRQDWNTALDALCALKAEIEATFSAEDALAIYAAASTQTQTRPLPAARGKVGRIRPDRLIAVTAYGAVASLLLAIMIALSSTTARAHDGPLPLIKHAGTPDVAVRVDAEHYVQVTDLPQFALDRAGLIDCVWFEDGSARCD